jgi:hypothetical protein
MRLGIRKVSTRKIVEATAFLSSPIWHGGETLNFEESRVGFPPTLIKEFVS